MAFSLFAAAVLAGLWSGFSLLETIDDEMLRKSALWLLLLAGLSLIVPRLVVAFGPFALDTFTPSAPPM